ncbi:PIG-L family deacetylase [Aquimarina hainanensis]|uniref:PIG-L family deacetylase n=1 Tax=Aquimarina hainanensis TaxID=1578017 RepID=A0ABW5NAG8_9FLAO
MRKLFIFPIAILIGTLSVYAQQPKKPNAVEIHEAIKKLNFLGSVLYVAAHPDDENTRLISYMANKVKARTAYLSLTRGDGGQNLIGPEIRELLGVIRTEELMAARATDGGEQLFTRANDFGYSKHPDETLDIWDKKEVLADVVWAIRKFKPDVIINRFNHRTPGTTHGHHTTSAMLSVEAFDIVNKKDQYPEQLDKVTPWQPKRLFFNTSWWFYGSREKFKNADKSNLISFDTGIYYPTSGLSNTEIASLSRSQHKSQGFGSTGTRGTQLEYIELIKGTFPKDSKNIFEGIDTSWNRIKGGKVIGTILHQVEKTYDFKQPEKSIPQLLKAYQLIQSLEDTHWKQVKTTEIKNIIAAAAGIYLEAVANTSTATPGSQLEINIEAINRSTAPFTLAQIDIPALGISHPIQKELIDNNKYSYKETGTVSNTEKYTSPYWLENKGTLGMYQVADQNHIGNPRTSRIIQANFILTTGTYQIPFIKEVVFKRNDPVKGEVYRPLEIVPEISVSIKDKVIIFADGSSKQIPVKIAASKNNLTGTLRLSHPQGWTITPENVPLSFKRKGEEKNITFTVTPPAEQHEGYLVPEVQINTKKFDKEIVTIDYDHIPYQTVVLPSETKVVRLDIKKKGQHIGYIEGAGDIVPESLEQIGYSVQVIDPQTITKNNLAQYDAIVIGIRAYNTIEALVQKQEHLLRYVENGGNLIVQYNTSHRLKVTDKLGPYKLALSRDRVTDENATVSFLATDHPVLMQPNKITQKDFEGWVQERGLYFPNQWAKEYQPIFAMHDKGETEKKGSLLVAKYGKGYYVYTGLSFFREFPAGVSGAYRLFANLLSLGK